MLRTKPAFISGDEADFGLEAKALGHHGVVRVEIGINELGNVTSAELKQSSRSDLLDAAALAAAKTVRFSPALDAEGQPMPLKFVTGYAFYQSKSREPGGGLVHYTCDAFTREMDWWDSIHPDADAKGAKDELYTMLLGLRTIAHPGGAMAGLRDGTVSTAHKADWSNARAQCRANPDRLLVDFLEQREMLRALAREQAKRAKH